MLEHIQSIGHASFRINITPSIMIDPWRVTKDDVAPDVILVSHEHYDHCSPADVNKLMGQQTKVIASPGAARSLDGNVTVLRPWQTINFGRTSIRTVPAYTFNGDHPARREDVGFIISSNYTDIYYAGDTAFVPELRNLRCDIAILPISSKDGVMSVNDAVELVKSARPHTVILSKYGTGIESGGRLELQAFQKALSNLTTVVVPGQSAFATR